MGIRPVAIVLVLATLGAGSLSARADTAVVHDRGDAYGFFDIAAASHSHGTSPGGIPRLRHTVRAAEPFRNYELQCAPVWIHIKPSDYMVVIFWRHGLKSKVYSDRGRTVARPPAWRTDRRTVTVGLKRRFLGIADHYKWAVKVASGDFECPRKRGTGDYGVYLDRAPNGGWVHHYL